MWVVESYSEKSKHWNVAYASNDEAETTRQYHMCRSLFPDATYRLVQVLKQGTGESKE